MSVNDGAVHVMMIRLAANARAEANRQLAALTEALRLHEDGAYAVACPTCGARIASMCYGNGVMAVPHGTRAAIARAALGDVLRAALKPGA